MIYSAKIVQMSEMKKKYAVFFFIPERRLSYEKIVQMSEKASSLLECFSECSLSYAKIVQASGMTKQNTQFLFFIPERRLSYEKIVQMSEKASSSLECFPECSLSYEKYIKGENKKR